MFVARYDYFPELAMAEGSPGKAYDEPMVMIEKIWMAKKEIRTHAECLDRG